MKYTMQPRKRRWPQRLFIIAIILAVLIVGGVVAVRRVYNNNLKPISQGQGVKTITIKDGATVDDIANLLQKEGVIRSAWAFRLYVSSKEVRNALQAGTYELEPSHSVPEIVSQLTHGKIATNLVTILPGQRVDQIKKRLLQDGFSEADVTKALDPATYKGHPALVDKPEGASLEGYIYPNSYQKTASTSAQTIIESALTEMQRHITPELRSAFARQNLSTYQAIILASIVEREVAKDEDRTQVAQVFLKRLKIDMKLESDATASYGSILDGQGSDSRYNSVYNTYANKGLTPTPISNISEASLKAVANPATTDWLYFVSGDDGTTHFSKTLEEHEAYTRQHCTTLCN